ncbi:hypothetical protein DPMN_040790 [Dreissena polymorpha]|uniref:Uncharacterized protein n=1 Tax=Dreissena polymorpha TaxID=45954 RepID=A0A9D4HX95_DREPO|nr:hypothetical protein DPMN_040790 [Dreissena polymorpha]
MFVCNKWDIVEERERNQPGSEAQVWQDTVDKLKKHLPGFSWDRYMYKMSTTEASRYITSGIGYTERYAALMGGLQKLILSSLTGNANTGRAREKLGWMHVHVTDLYVQSAQAYP